jgi:hypothetical protein
MGFKAFKGFLAVRLRIFYCCCAIAGDSFKSMVISGTDFFARFVRRVNTFGYLLPGTIRFSLASDNEMSDTPEQAFFFPRKR